PRGVCRQRRDCAGHGAELPALSRGRAHPRSGLRLLRRGRPPARPLDHLLGVRRPALWRRLLEPLGPRLGRPRHLHLQRPADRPLHRVCRHRHVPGREARGRGPRLRRPRRAAPAASDDPGGARRRASHARPPAGRSPAIGTDPHAPEHSSGHEHAPGKKRSSRRRRRRPRRPPPGAPPGTLAPAPDAHPAHLSLFAYDDARLVEHHDATLADLERRAAGLPKVWIDLQGLADVELIRALGKRYGLHPLTVADIVHVHQRPKLESHDDHLFIVLRLPHREGGLPTEQLSIVLGRDFLLTFQERPGDCFDAVRARLRRAGAPMRQRGVDYLAYALIDALVDAYFPLLETYGELVERLEEQVLAEPEPQRIKEIQRLRRDLLEVRRALWPQRDVLSALLREDTPCIEAGTRVFLRDCADHTAP